MHCSKQASLCTSIWAHWCLSVIKDGGKTSVTASISFFSSIPVLTPISVFLCLNRWISHDEGDHLQKPNQHHLPLSSYILLSLSTVSCHPAMGAQLSSLPKMHPSEVSTSLTISELFQPFYIFCAMLHLMHLKGLNTFLQAAFFLGPRELKRKKGSHL